jgi:hypothetical protein
MSECPHCDIHDMLEVHLQAKQADLAEIAARVTVVLTDLILIAPPDEQTMLIADILTNLGGMVLQKTQEDADEPANPRSSSHRLAIRRRCCRRRLGPAGRDKRRQIVAELQYDSPAGSLRHGRRPETRPSE